MRHALRDHVSADHSHTRHTTHTKDEAQTKRKSEQGGGGDGHQTAGMSPSKDAPPAALRPMPWTPLPPAQSAVLPQSEAITCDFAELAYFPTFPLWPTPVFLMEPHGEAASGG